MTHSDRRDMHDRYFRGRGLRTWLRMGAIHNPSAPQGRVTTPGVSDADAPPPCGGLDTANSETAAHLTTLPGALDGALPGSGEGEFGL